mgnify:FL=1
MKVVIVGGVTLLDVRTEEEYQRGHLDGFRNIPLDVLREHLDELDWGKVYGEFTVMYDPFNLSKII